MNFHVFKNKNPDTYPEVDCPMIVYDDTFNDLHICKWDNKIKKFFEEIEGNQRLLRHFDQCFYAYISGLPFIIKTLHPVKCTCKDGCEHEDDGYCMLHNEGCKYKKVVEEYSLDRKPIWKEFE